VPFNGLAEMLADDPAGEVLARAREHLAPGGALVFDVLVPNPRLFDGVGATTPWFSRDGRLTRCTQTFAYDDAERVLSVTTAVRAMDVDAPLAVFTLRQRQLPTAEVAELLEGHGFRVLFRTATFALPRPGVTSALEEEPEETRTDAVAYVCVPSR
jgi:hypothetical protein